MRGAGGESPEPGDEVPGNSANECSNQKADRKFDPFRIEGGDIDNVFPDRFSHCCSKEEGADKMTYRCHSQSHPGTHRPCGDNGGHDIGCIVEPIGVVKEKG